MYYLAVDSRYQQIIKQCVALMRQLNVPISRSVYFKYNSGCSRYGFCKKNTVKSASGQKSCDFTIAINKYILNDKDIATTVIHELLHTVDGAQNHQKTWRKWAQYVNANTQYTISRTGNYQLEPIAYRKKTVVSQPSAYDPQTMDVACCQCCGQTIFIRKQAGVRATGATKYICKKCKKPFYYV